MVRLFFLFTLLITLISAIPTPDDTLSVSPTATRPPGRRPSVYLYQGPNAVPIKDNYIVVYKPGVTDSQADAHEAAIDASTANRDSSLAGVGENINLPGLKAYSVNTDAAGTVQIASSGLVSLIEKDSKVNATRWVNQQNAGWPLQRISHRYPGNTSYTFDSTGGQGQVVYVLDTGILIEHQEFGGRAVWGANFVAGSPNTDDNGHGTHCAGTIGSTSYGVAKSAKLIAVKVLDSNGAGSYSNVIAGLQWVAMHASVNGYLGRAVASLSLAGGYSPALNAAVDALYTVGIPVVAAAGNVGQDAGGYSPASSRTAVTVAATDSNDNKPSWSNYGAAVDIFAPGVDIQSTWNNCPTCVNTMSGTSMATPHVAGMLSYLMSKNGIRRGYDALRLMNYLSIWGAVNNGGANSPNRLLFNGNGDNGGW